MADRGKVRILINLLPPEFLAEELKRAKFTKVQTIGVGVVLVMIFLASLTVALRILQSYSISRIQKSLGQVEEKVLSLKSRQASMVLLKNRLATIDKYLGETSIQNSMYTLLDKLIPGSVTVTSLSVDKSGDTTIIAGVPDSASLDNLMSNLISPDRNEGKIKHVSIESLNRGRDGFYRLSLKIEVK